jgi:hypothetical protein
LILSLIPMTFNWEVQGYTLGLPPSSFSSSWRLELIRSVHAEAFNLYYLFSI